ncbi:hypothetical protein DAERI_130133 [Deinococcus aerius]|uniref:DUF1579 domain-containing protein n=1 Tax=Deinococcus aerius TaxID=200253 RepID=A0A2I9CYQ2_9DEIO|nr:hypothetical protein [Deinococcus aerius]GBF07303.1 hypothetical protein DAERI_130133 [Deinococcus aerius]
MSAEPLTPNPDLRSLDRLVGTWQVFGDATGEVRYEWLQGGFFLMQHFDLMHDGRPIRGIEIIGHLYPFGGEPSADIHTRVYSYTDGMTLDYVYELEGDTLTIWAGVRDSPSFYRGTFSEDGRTVTGGWQWPGGGYTADMTRRD